jgi:hypothetical protein
MFTPFKSRPKSYPRVIAILNLFSRTSTFPAKQHEDAMHVSYGEYSKSP